MADVDDLIKIRAKEMAMWGRLRGAGFEPLTVAYSPQLTCWRVVIPLSADDDILLDMLNQSGLVVWHSSLTTDTLTATVSMLD